MSPGDVSVLLVDDDSMVRGWVRLALEDSEFRVIGEARGVSEAVELLRRRAPDVLLVDYRLVDGTGTELVRTLRESRVTLPVVVMTATPQRGFNEAARDVGAQGTVLKSGNVGELLETLRAVLVGERRFDSRHPARPAGRGALSPREREVLQLVASGSTNREIAATLGLGDETVKTLLARTFSKLGVRRRAEAVSAAHDRGLL